MTAFIMLCSSGVKSLVAVISLFLLALAARADNIEIKSAAVVLREDGFAVDADMEIALTQPLEDVLHKGIALNFLLEFELIRPRWYWFNEKLVTQTQQYKLAYNPLTRQYRISLGTIYQNFETLSEALRFISRPRNVPVADKALLQPGTTYSAALRMRLDVSQLPRPFQISVLGSREWNLSSDWIRFSVTP